MDVQSAVSRGGVEQLRRSASTSVAPPAPPRRWRTRVLLPLVLVGGSVATLVIAGWDAIGRATPVEVVPVIPVAARPGSVQAPGPSASEHGSSAAVQAPGWIEPDPYATNITALTDGLVKDVLVLEGDRVKAGQVVARLVDDDAKIQARRAESEVCERQAELAKAEADAKASKTTWDNPVERKRAVAVADAALAESKAELARLPLEIDAESAKLDEVLDELHRKEKLIESKAVAESDVAKLRLRAKAQEAALRASRAKQPVLEAKVKQLEAETIAAKENRHLRVEETREMAAAMAMVEAAKSQLAKAEAMRDEALLRLDRTEVKSPVDGIVMARLSEPWSKLMVGMDDPRSAVVARVYDPAKLQARVDVPLASAAAVGVGQTAEITVEALPGKVFHGVVTRMVHEANIQKNTVQFKVRIESPVAELKPEMLCRVKVLSGAGAHSTASTGSDQTSSSSVVMAPRRLIRSHDGHDAATGTTGHVWLVDQSRSRAEMRQVTIGSVVATPDKGSNEEWVEVVEGLRPGDRLIATEPGGLRPGRRVRVIGEEGTVSRGAH